MGAYGTTRRTYPLHAGNVDITLFITSLYPYVKMNLTLTSRTSTRRYLLMSTVGYISSEIVTRTIRPFHPQDI